MAEPATTVTIEPLQQAYVHFLLTIMANRPHRLQPLNSLEALNGRASDIDAQIIACRDWLAALVEDTAAHCSLPARTADVVPGAMDDMAGDIRGDLAVALDEIAEDRRAGQRPMRLVQR